MIWTHPAPSDEAGALTAFLAGELDLAEPPAVGDGNARREVADAIAAFIRQDEEDAGADPGRAGWPSAYLLMLLGRALWSLGDEPAARRLLDIRGRACALPAVCIEAVCAPDSSMVSWRLLLAARAVRDSGWTRAVTGAAWVLDLERLFRQAGVGLETAALTVLDAVLSRVAGVWDRSGGRGFLGLRRVEAAAAAVLGCPLGAPPAAVLVADVRAACQQRLEGLRRARSWTRVPEVVLLEL